MTRMLLPDFPEPRALRQFPESATLALLDAALFATDQVLHAAHPAVSEAALDPAHEVDPRLVTAHLIVTRAAELRDLLALHSVTLLRRHQTIRNPTDDDLF